MLILSRKNGESIVIGDGEDKVVLKVLEVRGGQIKLGISAPRKLSVHREEICKKIHEGACELGMHVKPIKSP